MHLFGRMLIERIENRILVGTIAFVGIMVLVGWVAINENARMASFTRQYSARSIERGAELFAANCSTCHGTDGRGAQLRAPALNSPHLFGFDYLAQWDDEIDTLNREVETLEAEKLTLQDEPGWRGRDRTPPRSNRDPHRRDRRRDRQSRASGPHRGASVRTGAADQRHVGGYRSGLRPRRALAPRPARLGRHP
ncbi:MAG: c-type cytochrome [Chloroflexi bacterium]|nr:c-type cytochrome [Chloroflexota bacterium]